MVLSRPGGAPVLSVRSAFGASFALLALSGLAGCAASQASTPPARISASPPYVSGNSGPPSIDIEDDGLPAQTPPLAGRKSEPDDPREPYSPNYGRTSAALPFERVRPGAVEKAETENMPAQIGRSTALPRSVLVARR